MTKVDLVYRITFTSEGRRRMKKGSKAKSKGKKEVYVPPWLASKGKGKKAKGKGKK